MGEQDSGLSLACSILVVALGASTLVLLNVVQTMVLGNIFSFVIWIKSFVCALPLALSIFLLVPLLSGSSSPCRTRLALMASLTAHPLQLLTFCVAGMLLHYLLPILNPILEFDIHDISVKLYLIFSGLFSGLYFYFELAREDQAVLKYVAYRTTWPHRLYLSVGPVLRESSYAALSAFKTFFPSWLILSYLSGLSIWHLIGVRLHFKIALMFFFTQSMLRMCLCLTRLIATNPRMHKIDSSVADEDSLISLLSSKKELEKLSAYQDLAILSRYRDPRRLQIFTLSIPGGKPKIWNAIWNNCFKVLKTFNSRLESSLTVKPSLKTPQKAPKPTRDIFSTPMNATPKPSTSPMRGFLWSKTSAQTSPGRSSTSTTTLTQPKSYFVDNKSKAKFSDRLSARADGLKESISTAIENWTKSVTSSVFALRPVSFWLEERPDFKTVSIMSDGNAVRLAMMAVSNVLACAPQEDPYGVTQEALPKAIRIFTKMGRNMDLLCRNNNQRVELRKLRNECRTALGKIQVAYGSSLEELNIEKRL